MITSSYFCIYTYHYVSVIGVQFEKRGCSKIPAYACVSRDDAFCRLRSDGDAKRERGCKSVNSDVRPDDLVSRQYVAWLGCNNHCR